MGAVFFLSAYSKLDPIEPFEYTFVGLGLINWQMAPFVARIIIGAEFFIATLLLLNIGLKKVAYKLSIGMLLLLSIYLVLLIVIVGDKGNCGCFGAYFEMTPSQALIKNACMLLILFVLYKYHAGWEVNSKFRILFPLLCIASLVMPFILNPVELNYSEAYLKKPGNNYKLELDSLYNNAALNVPPKTLSKGKHIIAFMSLTCSHCRIAAKKIRILSERNPEISFYFVLNSDDEENLRSFFEDTHTENIPYSVLKGRTFTYLAGMSIPSIYLVNNGMVEHAVNYMELDQGELEKWLNPLHP